MGTDSNIQIKLLPLLAASIVLMFSCSRNSLPKNSWEPKTYKAVTELIDEYGSGSRGYNPACRPYAVFDFDNTTIIGDIELTTMAYMLENLRLVIKPEDMFESLTKGFDDIDRKLDIYGNPNLTVRILAEDVTDDYKYLYDNYIAQIEGMSEQLQDPAFDKISETPEYKDFKAKTWTLSAGIYQNYDYAMGCLWLLRLYNGMTKDEQSRLVKEAAAHAFAIKSPYIDTWESPEMGRCGKVSIKLMRGLGLTEEMKSLYNSLTNNGFDVYICSASEENILEAVACDPDFGLGHDPDFTYGVRLQETADGLIDAEFDSTYAQTYKEGKTEAIKRYFAPLHCGRGPALVAGDSNGDYSMLTSFKDLKVGLILNCLNGGEIGDLTSAALEDKAAVPLKERTTPLYVVQGRNASRRAFIPSWESVPLEY